MDNYISFQFPHPHNEDTFLHVLYGDTPIDEGSVPITPECKRVSVCTVVFHRVDGELEPINGSCAVMDVSEAIHSEPVEWVKSMVKYGGV